MNSSTNNDCHIIPRAVSFENSYGNKHRSLLDWAEVGDTQLARDHETTSDLTSQDNKRETTKEYIQVRERLKSNQRKIFSKTKDANPRIFHAGDRVILRVSPGKGMIRLDKRNKLNPCYVGPLKTLVRVCRVSHKLQLPQDISILHCTSHVSNLKKCLSDETLVIPLDEIEVNENLNFVEEPVEIMNHKVKKTKLSRIPIVMVR